jgi:hypothetical protein
MSTPRRLGELSVTFVTIIISGAVTKYQQGVDFFAKSNFDETVGTEQ